MIFVLNRWGTNPNNHLKSPRRHHFSFQRFLVWNQNLPQWKMTAVKKTRFVDNWLFGLSDVILLWRHNCQSFDGPFDCDIMMKKSSNRCDVRPFLKGQSWLLRNNLNWLVYNIFRYDFLITHYFVIQLNDLYCAYSFGTVCIWPAFFKANCRDNLVQCLSPTICRSAR